MEDFGNRGANSSAWDGCTTNDVRLPYNRCGCVYALDLDGTFNAYHMSGLVCGTPTSSGLGFVPGNRCHMDRIASPDNVAYMPEHDTVSQRVCTAKRVCTAVWQCVHDQRKAPASQQPAPQLAPCFGWVMLVMRSPAS